MEHQFANKSRVRETALAVLAAIGVLMLTGVPRLRADQADCQRRIVHVHQKLHYAIDHHGAQSPQAEHWRHELRAERERCWKTYHKWWDEDQRRWHSERDWDDH